MPDETPRAKLEGELRIRFTGVPWHVYEALDAARGPSSGVRMTYCAGELELMVPGKPHEKRKSLIGRLIEAYAEEKRIDLVGLGSWTLKKELVARGGEPDECFVIDPERADDAEVPDFAVEVIVSSGGVEKLDVYRPLAVPEVWFYVDGRVQVYVLEPTGYTRVNHSRTLPGLDIALLERCMSIESPLAALDELRRGLRDKTFQER